jgi:hypothetical protein
MLWPDDPREAAEWLARKLAVLPEAPMRGRVLCEALSAAPPSQVVAALHQVLRAARINPAPPYTVAVVALAQALSEPNLVGYDQRAELYGAAKEQGLGEVARLFFAAGTGPGEPKVPGPEQPVGAGRTLTLGERKALARSQGREVLARLLRDPDVAVIRVLLENPRLIEADVVLVAARRPARGDVLRAVFASRWITRYHVKRALVMNPYTPGDLAVRLCAALETADLRAVAQDGNLATPVREQAKILLGHAPPDGQLH